MLLEEGFDHASFLAVKEALEKEGARSKIVSRLLGPVRSSGGEEVEAHESYLTTASVMFDAVFVPGGRHVEALKDQGDSRHWINESFRHCKPIAAAGEAIGFLKATGIEGINLDPKGKGASAEQGVVLGPSGGDLVDFAGRFVEAVAAHRHWDRELKAKVPA